MDHTVQTECHNMKHSNPYNAKARVMSNSFSQAAFILAAIAFISLFSSSSIHISSHRLHEVGSLVMSKKALFVLSNAIFLFLAADYYCCFFSLSPSTDDFITACERNGVLDKRYQRRQFGAEPCAAESCAHHSEIPCHSNDASEDHGHDERQYDAPEIHEDDYADDERKVDASDIHGDVVAVSSQPGLFRPDGEDANSIVVDLETVVIEEPACGSGTAQELEELGIDELNRKFEEFIQRRRMKWEEEASQTPYRADSDFDCCQKLIQENQD